MSAILPRCRVKIFIISNSERASGFPIGNHPSIRNKGVLKKEANKFSKYLGNKWESHTREYNNILFDNPITDRRGKMEIGD